MRKIMTREELATFHVSDFGRDYRYCDDGYSDMAFEEKRGWTAVGGWGRDGWNLGDWPYVALYARRYPDTERPWGLMQIVEGDRSTYAFASQEDFLAAMDYLFLWYSAGEEWSPVTYENREQLDAGELEVDGKFRGSFSWDRVNDSKALKEACAECGCPEGSA